MRSRRSTRRAEEESGDAALEGRLAHAIAELEEARDRARQRLERTVAALELLRLDLLRLSAGVVTFDDISLDLTRARELGTDIDLRIDARREVDSLIADTATDL
jgi:CRP-like cAMP-binding protein